MSAPRKRFAHTSNTWQLFQKYFFLDQERYPYSLGAMPRGKAINLVQGLNCCNVQWAEEQSMPHSFLTLSAKAKKLGEGPDSSWTVEISTNYRKQGLASPSKGSRGSTDWMQELLARDTGSPSSKGDTTSSPNGEAASPGVYVPRLTSPCLAETPSPVSEEEGEESNADKALRLLGFGGGGGGR